MSDVNERTGRNPDRHTQIVPEVLRRIYAHAREAYPEECCGVLIGPRETCSIIDEARPCENVQNRLHERDPQLYPRDALTAYSMGPRDLIFLYESLRSSRPVKVVYHSHADVGAYFSHEDRRMALALFENGEPVYDLSYLVMDARADRVAGAKLFRWDPVQHDFVQIAQYTGE